MASSNGLITAPVSFSDVNSVLGTAHTDLASLCTDKNINPWSKIKPVEPSNGQIVVTPLGLPSQGYANNRSYKTIEENWGLIAVDQNGDRISGAMTLGDISSKWGNCSDSYQYVKKLIDNCTWIGKKPTSACRLTDFNGYDHKAVPFIFDNYTGAITVKTHYGSMDVPLSFFLSGNTGSLTIAELSSYVIGGTTLGDMYLCAVYDGDSQGEVFSNKLSTYYAGDDIDFLLPDLTSDYVYKVYMCLATKQDFWDDCRLFPLPNTSKLHSELTINVDYQNIFANLTLIGISSTNIDNGLSTVDLRNEVYQNPEYYDAYAGAHILGAPSGKGVILKITAKVGPSAITISPSLFQMALNTGTSVSAAVQIVGTNSNCQDHPSTSTSTFNLVANGTYTFYVVATSVVADAVNEIQLSMTVSGHTSEGMQAASPWMNVHTT